MDIIMPESRNTAAELIFKTDIIVIGAGQAGLSSAYYLKQQGLTEGRGFVILDQSPHPGGAWQFRWPSLTLSTVNGIHDLPGLPFSSTIDIPDSEVKASAAVPHYFEEYEKKFDFHVYRPVKTNLVCDRGDRFRIETNRGLFSAKGIINATGSWESPYIPDYPGKDLFEGIQLHTKDYQSANDFLGKHVIIVGGGISAIQLLDEISMLTTTTWVTRNEPNFREGPWADEAGRAAVQKVEDRVRQGLPPGSIVSVTGIPLTPAIVQMKARGVLNRQPMFSEITSKGVRWADGTETAADVILWCTGFRSGLDHLAPLMLREEGAGILMGGRLATQVMKDPRVHLVGYGPSASTIGANRAGRAAATELMGYLGL
jgi:thioredoxin reductase